MHTTHSNTQYKNDSKHSEMGPVRQNPIQRTVSLLVCIALCTIVAHNIAQNRPDSFPPYPPDRFAWKMGVIVDVVTVIVLASSSNTSSSNSSSSSISRSSSKDVGIVNR